VHYSRTEHRQQLGLTLLCVQHKLSDNATKERHQCVTELVILVKVVVLQNEAKHLF